jgi:Gas vesicle protein K
MSKARTPAKASRRPLKHARPARTNATHARPTRLQQKPLRPRKPAKRQPARPQAAKQTPKKRAAKPARTAAQLETPHALSHAEALQPDQLAALRAQLDARLAEAMPARWNPDPEEVRRAVMKLVLTIVDFVRQLLERQAVRRMEAQTLTPEQIEAVGLALMRLEEAVRDLAKQSGLEYSELNLDLGPLGRLL